MKKITLLFFLLTASFGFSQTAVNYDPSAPLSFVEAFEVSGGASAAQFGYDPAFTQTVDGTNATIIPNTEIWTTNNGSNPSYNTFWFSAQGVPSKTLDVLTFNEVQWDGTGTAPSVSNTELTFSVDLSAYDLDPSYSLDITITIFEAGFSNFRRERFTIPNTTGVTYSVTFPSANVSANDRIWQWGFLLSGPMADPADTTLGSATFAQTTLSTNKFELADFNVSPNPSNNVWNIKAQQTIDNIQVFDVLGKQVMDVKPNDSDVELNASVLPKGLYFAKMTTEFGSNTIKLIKN